MILHENACVLREVRSESMCICAAVTCKYNEYGVDSELFLFCG